MIHRSCSQAADACWNDLDAHFPVCQDRGLGIDTVSITTKENLPCLIPKNIK